MKENKVDTKEFVIPETMFIRDIENKVFQSIILQCLGKIKGISLLEGNLVDSLLGREVDRGVKGIQVEQDSKNHSVKIRVEVNVAYGICLPQKAEEIQSKVLEEVSQLTGLHISVIHVVFKGLLNHAITSKVDHLLDPIEQFEDDYAKKA